MNQDEMFEVVPDFDGFHYEPKKDRYRLAGQMQEIFDVIEKADKWLTLDEINEYFWGKWSRRLPEASISAQLRNLRKERFGGHDIKGRYRNGTRTFEYRLEAR